MIIDFVCKRDNFYNNAKKIFALGYLGELELRMSSLSIINTMYIGKKYGIATIKERLKAILKFVEVYSIETDIVIEALDSDWEDYEDAVQFKSATKVYADCIVTRNKKDFTRSDIPVYTVDELLDSLIIK
ncbi:MAG: PIN domain-containing protein [Prevotella sp.]|nr:PIN domain-containing protein [Prevotella sp.]